MFSLDACNSLDVYIYFPRVENRPCANILNHIQNFAAIVLEHHNLICLTNYIADIYHISHVFNIFLVHFSDLFSEHGETNVFKNNGGIDEYGPKLRKPTAVHRLSTYLIDLHYKTFVGFDSESAIPVLR